MKSSTADRPAMRDGAVPSPKQHLRMPKAPRKRADGSTADTAKTGNFRFLKQRCRNNGEKERTDGKPSVFLLNLVVFLLVVCYSEFIQANVETTLQTLWRNV